MNMKSAKLTLKEAQENIDHWEHVALLVWRDIVKSKTVFMLKKGNMRHTPCRVIFVAGHKRVEIERLDNAKSYMVHPSHLRWIDR